MPLSKANEDKARFIFEQVFAESKLAWVGPEQDFDSDRYKARVQGGDLKGQLLYISTNNLEDRNVSAENIKQRLLTEIKGQLAQIRK